MQKLNFAGDPAYIDGGFPVDWNIEPKKASEVCWPCQITFVVLIAAAFFYFRKK